MSINFSKSLPRAVQLAHEIVSSRVGPGDTAVDATVGNGHDTLFLAKLVGETGTVVGFDIQESAIETAKNRIPKNASVDFHLECHSAMSRFLDEQVSAVMFNLGYLPSGDKSIITTPDSTLSALKASIEALKPCGVVTVVAYSGHPGGEEEKSSVAGWCRELPQSEFSVVHYGFLNQANNPPQLFAIEKLA